MQNRLHRKQRILVATTLFGMFFGAGNLIFPVHLGQLAGRNAVSAMIGFIITAVGIPILGVAAIGNTHSDGLQSLANKVGKGYGYFFTCLLYLTIGPFFAIPRCATTSFTIGILPLMGSRFPESLGLFIFSLVFFVLVLLFSLRPARITVWIGKIINPLFLVFFAILVITALCHPGASISSVEPDSTYQSGALFSAFIEGYGTMDAIAGLAFGIVVIDIIRAMGITDDSAIAMDVLHSGILTGLLMAGIYVATILMGAQSRGLFDISENGGIALAQISSHYLGTGGSIVLALTVTFACLKTSIGLVTSCAESFTRMFPKGFSYKAWATVFTIFSFCISNFGLSKIIASKCRPRPTLGGKVLTKSNRALMQVNAVTHIYTDLSWANNFPESARTISVMASGYRNIRTGREYAMILDNPKLEIQKEKIVKTVAQAL